MLVGANPLQASLDFQSFQWLRASIESQDLFYVLHERFGLFKSIQMFSMFLGIPSGNRVSLNQVLYFGVVQRWRNLLESARLWGQVLRSLFALSFALFLKGRFLPLYHHRWVFRKTPAHVVS